MKLQETSYFEAKGKDKMKRRGTLTKHTYRIFKLRETIAQ